MAEPELIEDGAVQADLCNNVVSGRVAGYEARKDDGGRPMQAAVRLLDAAYQGLQVRVLLQATQHNCNASPKPLQSTQALAGTSRLTHPDLR